MLTLGGVQALSAVGIPRNNVVWDGMVSGQGWDLCSALKKEFSISETAYICQGSCGIPSQGTTTQRRVTWLIGELGRKNEDLSSLPLFSQALPGWPGVV